MMMVKAGKQDDEKTGADEAASFSNLAESSAKLFAEQAAAMAVFTAYGMSIAAQMTGMMLGALRGPGDNAASEVQTEAKPDSNVVHLRPVQVPMAKVPPKVQPAKAPVKKAPAKRTVAKSAVKVAVLKADARAATNSADDLKKISGIGPRLEKVLNDRGIAHYGEIAKLSKAALNKLDGELGLEGRVIRDDWAGQAKALSGGKR